MTLDKKDNSNKIILDLCGGTGSWSMPYKEAGYDVRLVTTPENDVRTYKLPDEPIYGILAAPPCTMFSLARTTAKTPRDFNEGMEIVEACLNLIWQARKRGKLAFWALENPMGYLRQFLGKPPFTFTPTDFGDRYTKKTDIWGYFNYPVKRSISLSEEEEQKIKRGHGNPTPLTQEERHRMSINNRLLPNIEGLRLTVAARRAITPQGFALAFYKANK
ncbi:MAG: hypothetical protein WC243_04680 [Patescibacteria group bacterium]|jgi:hypothetical protein